MAQNDTKPRAPRHLKAATRRWFEQVVSDWELEAHHVEALTAGDERHRQREGHQRRHHFWNNLTLKNSTLRANRATKDDENRAGGGAIFIGGSGTARIAGSIFRGADSLSRRRSTR